MACSPHLHSLHWSAPQATPHDLLSPPSLTTLVSSTSNPLMTCSLHPHSLHWSAPQATPHDLLSPPSLTTLVSSTSNPSWPALSTLTHYIGQLHKQPLMACSLHPHSLHWSAPQATPHGLLSPPSLTTLVSSTSSTLMSCSLHPHSLHWSAPQATPHGLLSPPSLTTLVSSTSSTLMTCSLYPHSLHWSAPQATPHDLLSPPSLTTLVSSTSNPSWPALSTLTHYTGQLHKQPLMTCSLHPHSLHWSAPQATPHGLLSPPSLTTLVSSTSNPSWPALSTLTHYIGQLHKQPLMACSLHPHSLHWSAPQATPHGLLSPPSLTTLVSSTSNPSWPALSTLTHYTGQLHKQPLMACSLHPHLLHRPCVLGLHSFN